jgi:hypothetical protein
MIVGDVSIRTAIPHNEVLVVAGQPQVVGTDDVLGIMYAANVAGAISNGGPAR